MSWTGRSLACSCVVLLAAACNHRTTPKVSSGLPESIHVTSSAFADGARLPVEYTCDGAGHAPELRWSGVPSGATSITVVVDDPDAPGGTYLHWRVTGLDVATRSLSRDAHVNGATWKPPCPPRGATAHHYRFTVYAMDAQDHAIAYGRVVATFSR